jgi:hypothetical protein
MQFVDASTLSPVTAYRVFRSEGRVPVCVEVAGSSRKQISATVTAGNGTAYGTRVSHLLGTSEQRTCLAPAILSSVQRVSSFRVSLIGGLAAVGVGKLCVCVRACMRVPWFSVIR